MKTQISAEQQGGWGFYFFFIPIFKYLTPINFSVRILEFKSDEGLKFGKMGFCLLVLFHISGTLNVVWVSASLISSVLN